MNDDIPEARRQYEPARRNQPKSAPLPLALILGGVGGLALLILSLFLMSRFWSNRRPIAANTDSPNPLETTQDSTIEGHFPYEVAPPDQLTTLSSNPEIQLQFSAAEAFDQMVEEASRSGIYLIGLSGFRTIEDQRYLFFEVKKERNQVTRDRAKVSAPPGHSEHHTGYAIDIGDLDAPETHIQESFEETEAFRWLEANAARYSFELSFPPGNAQGVSYEPWHWRFVGDQDSLETFFKGRNSSGNS